MDEIDNDKSKSHDIKEKDTINNEKSNDVTKENLEDSLSIEDLLEINKEDEDGSETHDDRKNRLHPILPTHTRDEIENRILSLIKNRDLFKVASEKTGTLENTLMRMVDVFSDQFSLLNNVLEKVADKLKDSVDDKEKGISIKDSYPNLTKDFEGKEISGKDAKIYILANKRNVKRIKLLNSGFYVLIQSPTLTDLTIMYNKISDQLGEYGRLFGTYFYLYSDLTIKEVIIEFICKLIISSNLKGWQKGNNLTKHISIHDYPILLHGLASLMFKDGYKFKYQCPNDNYSETTDIDLNTLKYYNFNKISEDSLKFLSSSDLKSSKEVFSYQKSLDLTEKIKVGQYLFTMKVPSIDEYLKYGDSYNADLMEMVQNGNTENIQDYLRFSYFKLFTPWISTIAVLKEDDSVNFRVSDIDSKCLILDELQLSNAGKLDDIIDPIVEFIKETMLTHIVIPVNECPTCGKLPKSAINGFFPIDMQETFFSMSTMRLIL
jgi:hypothetical protein